jgi:hypothetical protein
MEKWRLKMKRLGLIALLLLGGALNACADNDVYNNTSSVRAIGGVVGSSCPNV